MVQSVSCGWRSIASNYSIILITGEIKSKLIGSRCDSLQWISNVLKNHTWHSLPVWKYLWIHVRQEISHVCQLRPLRGILDIRLLSGEMSVFPTKVSVFSSMKSMCIRLFLCWQLTPDQELPPPSSRNLSSSPPFMSTHLSLSCPSCGKTPAPWPRTPSSLGASRQSGLQGWLWMWGKDHKQYNTDGLARSQGTQGSPAGSWGIHLYLHLDYRWNTQPYCSLPSLDLSKKCTLGDWFLRNVTLDPW